MRYAFLQVTLFVRAILTVVFSGAIPRYFKRPHLSRYEKTTTEFRKPQNDEGVVK